ncbi:MAG: ABC transporter substrate-binding protein, partial [candidate division KSB1 bacterium]|nr:ABC transporter substrate-binding protein [candidate division KSB1 bacterium]
GYGFIEPMYQQALPNSAAYNPTIQGREYSVEKAKQLLAEAGYPDGFKYKIIVSPTGMDRDMMVAVKSYLEKVGIIVELEFPEYAKYLEYRYGTWSGAFLAQPTGMFPNYNSHIGAYWVAASQLFLSLDRPQALEELYSKSVKTLKPDPEMFKEMVKIIHDEALVIPLYNSKSGAIVQNYVCDTGYLSRNVHFTCVPENAWLNK